ncbi:uncharacterized protein LOC134702403 [Mytilus trossulus]|uniref:uncharacterized protein LOC134702403 n=1 Tax=Mytilus trossulus TaxID=6551 RepID=UPI0030040CBB
MRNSGPICYKCSGVSSMTVCKTITTCPLNELCIIESNDRNGEIYFNSGCQTKYACDMLAGTGNILGKREINGPRPGYCKRCCAGDLCNTECSIDLKTTSSVTTTKTIASITPPRTTTVVTTPMTTGIMFIGVGNIMIHWERNFNLAFLASFGTPPAYAQLYIISDHNGTCMIRIPYLHINTSMPVIFNDVSQYRINSSILMTTLGIQHKAIIVSCDVPVSIYGMNYRNVVTEGYLGIPQNGLRSKYIVSSFSQDKSEFGIIAPSNDTFISINLRLESGDLKYNGNTYRPGDLLNITMFKDETFYLSSDNDLSGTIISSTKPVAVVSGVKLSFMNDEYSNHMTEMILPHKHLGRNFIVPVLYNSQCRYRIFADSPSSLTIQQGNYTISGFKKNITAGQYLEVNSDKPTTLRSSSGILVQLYCDSHGLSYDSVMVTLPAISHFKAGYQFVAVSDFPPGYQPNNYYMTVIIPTNAVDGLKYDGYLWVSFIQKFSIVVSGHSYSILIKEISSGLHTLTQVNNVTFGLIVNGKTTHQGYAYPAGFHFNNGAQ